MRPTSRHDFHIAIFCATPTEAEPIKALFDETYDTSGTLYGREVGDPNTYLTGRIAQHNVVLCTLTRRGKVAAASAAAYLRMSYTRIHLALVVGVCGAAPFAGEGKIILGDVVISTGIVEYDFGTLYPDRFRRKTHGPGVLAAPDRKIRAFLTALQRRVPRRDLVDRGYGYLQTLTAESAGMKKDVSFEPLYRRRYCERGSRDSISRSEAFDSEDTLCEEALEKDSEVLGCPGSPVEWERRLAPDNSKPSVHFEKVASGDRLIASEKERDCLVYTEKTKAFEMEGAGIWGTMPTIIIKGVCSYADGHESQVRQEYAAATAASISRAFLETWPAGSEDSSPTPTPGIDLARRLRELLSIIKRSLNVRTIASAISHGFGRPGRRHAKRRVKPSALKRYNPLISAS